MVRRCEVRQGVFSQGIALHGGAWRAAVKHAGVRYGKVYFKWLGTVGFGKVSCRPVGYGKARAY